MTEKINQLLNKYKFISFIVVVLLIIVAYFIALTISLGPAYYFIKYASMKADETHTFTYIFIMGAAVTMSIFIFSMLLIFTVAFLNWIFPFKIKPWRGKYYSINVIPWYYHNALVQLVRYTILNMLTPSPLNILFFKLMGMKIGKNCMINTSNISDPCMITLEDNVTIGGSATIFAHYAQGGYMIIAPVILKSGCTVGLKASIMGDVIIGEKVLVKPHDIVLPKSRLERELK